MKLEALIFDVDGTLADTEEAHRSAFNQAFDQLDIGWHWDKPTYARLLLTTGGKERLAVHIESLPLTPAEKRAWKARVGEIHAAKTACYTERVLAGKVPLRAGVRELIEAAPQAGVRLCIASTTTLANIDALLCTALGEDAMARFSVVGAGDQVAHKKPAPDIYEFVLRRLDVPPSDCVAIEDSANGLRAAKAAGLFTIVTPSYWTAQEDFAAADWVLPTLDSLEIDAIRECASDRLLTH